MTKSLRAEILELAERGSLDDLDANGRLAIKALLMNLERASEVIEAARQNGCCFSSECCGDHAKPFEDALARWDAMANDEHGDN